MRKAGLLLMVAWAGSGMAALGCSTAPYSPQRTALMDTEVPPEVVYWKGTFAGAGGIQLHEQSWRPARGGRAAIVLLHGLKDHSSRYREVAIRLVNRGYSVHTFDMRGHGYSEGVRDHFDSVNRCLEDLRLFLWRVVDREKGKPVFLMGQGLGATLGALYAVRTRSMLAGLVLSGPMLRAEVKAGERFGTQMASVFTPTAHKLKLDLADWSSDPDAVAVLKGDSLINGGEVTASTVGVLLAASDELQRRAGELTVPLLVLQGSADKVADPELGRSLHARMGGNDKTIKSYPGLYHDLLHEKEAKRDEVVAELAEWMSPRAVVKPPPPPPAAPAAQPAATATGAQAGAPAAAAPPAGKATGAKPAAKAAKRSRK
jgi:alpha-beta hydrolase superfamily lysophospholipase